MSTMSNSVYKNHYFLHNLKNLKKMFTKLTILFCTLCISNVLTENEHVVKSSNRPPQSFSKLDPNFLCPLRKGRFPRSNDCRSFHHCHDGVARLVLCPPFTLYDVRLRACFFSPYATCFVDEPFACPTADGKYRHDRCDRYFLCRGGVSYLRHCPYLSTFDTSVKRCVLSLYAQCEDASVPQNGTSNATTKNGTTTKLGTTSILTTTNLTTTTTELQGSSTSGTNSTTVSTDGASTLAPT